jgi:hypothetical protein
MRTEQAPKVNVEAVPVIDFSLANTDREAYFKQLQFAVEDVGFGVSTFVLSSLQIVCLFKSNRFSKTFQALRILTKRRSLT